MINTTKTNVNKKRQNLKVSTAWIGRINDSSHKSPFNLLDKKYMSYIFHSFKLMELQSQTLGIPQIKVKIKKSYEDILATLERLNREVGVEAFVTGDIVGAGCAQIHQTYYNIMLLLPKELFFKSYPVSPKTFGEKLGKARMDSDMQIKDLAGMLGVTEDTVIN